MYTVEEVADLLKVDKRTVLTWIRQGRLETYKLGYRTLRISQEQLDKFLSKAA